MILAHGGAQCACEMKRPGHASIMVQLSRIGDRLSSARYRLIDESAKPEWIGSQSERSDTYVQGVERSMNVVRYGIVVSQ